MVDFRNPTSWCEPRAFPCEQPSRERSPTPQIEQRAQVALAGSMAGEAWTELLLMGENVDFACLGRTV